MADEAKREELQQKHQQLQMIDQQLQILQQQGQLVEKQSVELQMVEQALEEFKHVKEGGEILVPLSSGIYAKGTLQSNKGLIANVGAGVAVEKSVDGVKKMITEQREEMEKMQKEIAENLQKLATEGVQLQETIQKLM